ncbi:DODA-type extradiol aromatic ring-opening family dioxygenase [Sphingobium xenophagum]
MELSGLVAMSHAPGWNMRFDHQGPGERFVAAVSEARALVTSLNPDVLVIFGPDHFRNFFYDAMPPFCIGIENVEAFGDYRSLKGPMPSDPGLGRFIVDQVMSDQFDPTTSFQMGVDHGISASYVALAPQASTRMVPIMINCVGAVMPSLRRCYEFGQAVGRAIRAYPGDGRAVVIGSGGLSHWVPSGSPFDASLTPERRDYVINGRSRAQAHNAAMEALSDKMISEGHEGPINKEWDEWFLSQILAGDLNEILKVGDDALTRDAGNAGHEVRAWVAAIGAWGGPIRNSVYEPVPTWLTGMGCITAVA